MAGSSITFTEQTSGFSGGVKLVIADWTSDDSTGAVSASTTNKYNGVIQAVAFEPDSGGTQPTNLYDVTITDSNSVDLAYTGGANLSNAAMVLKTYCADGLFPVANSALTVNVTNAGNSKGGKVYIYIR